jgi:hypothetical protein
MTALALLIGFIPKLTVTYIFCLCMHTVILVTSSTARDPSVIYTPLMPDMDSHECTETVDEGINIPVVLQDISYPEGTL